MKKFFYWFLSLTWGLPMTLIGLIVSLVLLITGHKPYKFGYTFYFRVGKNWGGLELGAIFITDQTPLKHTLYHEHGHGFQNCVLGIIYPFLIGIPSAIRYWYRELKYYRKNKQPSTTYDSIWFEGQATRLGNKYIRRS